MEREPAAEGGGISLLQYYRGRRLSVYWLCNIVRGDMDKETRLGILVLVIAITVWRFARYMRFGLSRSRRPTSLGVAGGVVPQDSDRGAPPVAAAGTSVPAQSSLYARFVGVLVAVGLWLAINALLWYCLLELPPFKSLPPVPVGVAGIFVNFYLIPLAQRTGGRARRRIDEVKSAG